MERKTTTVKGLKEVKADEGFVAAIFSTFNAVDLDGDVTLPGAFGKQDVRIAQWGHNWGDLPIGKGTIREQGTDAIVDSNFFLDTDHGRNAFGTVKGLGDLQEWSYGFDVLKSSFGEFEGQPVRFLERLKVHEVSPVMLGAGIGTRTLEAKGFDPTQGLPFLSHAEVAGASLADVKAFLDRASSLADVRAKEGRTFSSANLEKLTTLAATMRESLAALETLLAGKAPADDTEKARDALAAELARFVSITRTL